MLTRIVLAATALLIAPAPSYGAPESPPDLSDRPAISWQGATKVRWSNSFGTDKADWANRTIELANGDIVTTGFVNRQDDVAHQDWDVVLRRYSANGQIRWTRRIGGKGLDAGWAVRQLADGRLAIAGFSSSQSAGEDDAYLVLTDKAGRRLSEHWYGGTREDRATDLVVADDGSLLLVGQTESMGSGKQDVFVVRTDANGRELWRRAYGGPGLDRGFFAAKTVGGYIISGMTGEDSNTDYLVMKIDDRGNEIWRRVITGEKNDPNHGVVVRKDGTILFAGYTESWGARVHDISIILLSADGRVLHHDIIGGADDDRVQFITLASDGGAWLTGYTKSFGKGDYDILVAHVGRDGHLEP